MNFWEEKVLDIEYVAARNDSETRELFNTSFYIL